MRPVARRNDRVILNLPIDLIVDGKKLRAVSQDLSPYGMFVRITPPLPVGSVVQVVLAPNGERLRMTGEVTHALSEVEARTLGRHPGVGILFRAPVRRTDHAFIAGIVRLLEGQVEVRARADVQILVADPEPRLLERLSTALGTAGFDVMTATNGLEAISACLSRRPDVALVECEMPVMDGVHVLQEMGRHAELASVPVLLMSAKATDLERLELFQAGAADFIPKPFTVLEVILRARRWAMASARPDDRVVLRGSLQELNLPVLLQMFEQEKKTGQLAITREQRVAWLDFVEGRLVRARSSEPDVHGRDVVLRVLDWREGFFELTSGAPAPGEPELEASITHLLLEHARLSDEATR